MDKIVFLETLLAEWNVLQDRCRQDLIADIDEKIAKDILGWRLDPGDVHRIWHTKAGEPVDVVAIGDGKRYKVCKHPWVDGINTAGQVSYSPGHNYHRKFID